MAVAAFLVGSAILVSTPFCTAVAVMVCARLNGVDAALLGTRCARIGACCDTLAAFAFLVSCTIFVPAPFLASIAVIVAAGLNGVAAALLGTSCTRIGACSQARAIFAFLVGRALGRDPFFASVAVAV